MDDQSIVQLLKQGQRSKGFQKLYKGYPPIKKFILSKGGTKADAEDIFQEALIIFYRKVQAEEFKLSSAISTYLFSVCRFLWKDELKKRKNKQVQHINSGLLQREEDDVTEIMERESKVKQAEQVLRQIGERCLSLLRLFYYERLSMTAIAEKMGFKSEKVAKNQKYKCLERARLKFAALHIEEGGLKKEEL